MRTKNRNTFFGSLNNRHLPPQNTYLFRNQLYKKSIYVHIDPMKTKNIKSRLCRTKKNHVPERTRVIKVMKLKILINM